jgi:hypothetical protein
MSTDEEITAGVERQIIHECLATTMVAVRQAINYRLEEKAKGLPDGALVKLDMRPVTAVLDQLVEQLTNQMVFMVKFAAEGLEQLVDQYQKGGARCINPPIDSNP